MDILRSPGAHANPKRGLKLFNVGLLKNSCTLVRVNCRGSLVNFAATCSVTATKVSAIRLSRVEIRWLSSSGTVTNSYRNPRLKVSEGMICQLSWKYEPNKSCRRFRGGLSCPGVNTCKSSSVL